MMSDSYIISTNSHTELAKQLSISEVNPLTEITKEEVLNMIHDAEIGLLLDQNLIDEALIQVAKKTCDYYKDNALEEIIWKLLFHNQIDRALEVLDKMTNKLRALEIIIEFGPLRQKPPQIDRALEIINQKTTGYDKDWALKSIIIEGWFLRQDPPQINEARKIAEQISDEKIKREAHRKIDNASR